MMEHELSKITDVTIFLNGSQITRNQTFQVEAGINYLKFTGLPTQIHPETISVIPDGHCTVLSATYRFVSEGQLPSRISELKSKLEKLLDQQSFQLGIQAICSEEEELVRANCRISEQNTSRNPVQDVRATTEYFRQRLTELCVEKLAQQKELTKLAEEIGQIESEIGTISYSQQMVEVDIELFCEVAGAHQLVLSYYMPDANWHPYYDVRAIDVESPVELQLKAFVQQNSGEDWSNVKLTLSTGDPILNGTVPKLEPWYIDYEQKSELYRSMADTTVSASFEEHSFPLRSKMVAREVLSGVEYTLETPATIPSATHQKSVDIQSYSLKAQFKHVAVSKLEQDVFLIAVVQGWEQINLLSGEANIFFEGKYVGKSYIDPQQIEEALELSLGRDKGVIVRRVKGKNYTSKSFIGSNIKTSREWEYSVRNSKSHTIQLMIEDQLPISTNKGIVVEADQLSGAQFDQKTGKLTWVLQLEPSQVVEMPIKYTVSYPKDAIVRLD